MPVSAAKQAVYNVSCQCSRNSKLTYTPLFWEKYRKNHVIYNQNYVLIIIKIYIKLTIST